MSPNPPSQTRLGSFCSRLLPQCLLLVLILLPLAQATAKTVSIGSGSGTLSVTSMSSLGLNAGDTISIATGTYSGGTFINLNNITIVPATGGVTFTGSIFIGDDDTVVFDGTVLPGVTYGYTFSNFVVQPGAGSAFEPYHTAWNAPNVGNTLNCAIKGVQLLNTGGSLVDGVGYSLTYTGTPATCLYYHLTLDTILETGSSIIYNGQFTPNSSYNVVNIGMTARNVVCINDGTGDCQKIYGTSIYNLLVDNWTIVGPTKTWTGDEGIFGIDGNCVIRNVYRNGGWGWLGRLHNCSLGTPSTTYVYNCVDVNNVAYGTVDTYVDRSNINPSATIPIVGNDIYLYNVTSGNHQNATGYTTSLLIDYGSGDAQSPETVYTIGMINCLAFNNPGGMTSLYTDENSDTPSHIVQSNNIVISGTLPSGYVTDQNTFYPAPGGPLIGTGATETLFTTDLYGKSRGSSFDIGAVQHDTIAPTLAITSPTTGGTYSTGASTVSVSGTASDNDYVASVTWTNSLGGSGTAGTNTTWSGTGIPVASTTWSVSNITLYPGNNVLTFTAHDASGNTSTTTMTVAQGSGSAVAAINCGSTSSYTAASGIVYSADTYYTGGSPYQTWDTISGTSDPNLYNFYRYANGSGFSYAIPLANGTYSVTLRFCETNHGNTVGSRVGNYSIQGTAVLSNFDILATAGAYDTPIDRTFSATVSSGTLNIAVGIVTGSPRLDAIVVQTSSSSTAPTITNGPPPSTATVGTAYSFAYTAGGTPTPTFTVSAGSLPAGLTLSSVGAISGTPTTAGTYSGTVTASNGVGTAATQNFSITVSAASSSVAVAINCGMTSSYTASDGTVYSADTYYSGGSPYQTWDSISSSDPNLYNFYRYASGSGFSYAIPLANGNYTVTLRFCETNHGDGIGARVGNYSLQGTTVLSNFDILATAGAYDTPIDETFSVSVTSGTLNVGVGIVTGGPRIDAIVVRHAAPVLVAAVNCGSTSSYTASDGTVYSADTYYSGGSSYQTWDTISSSDPTLYNFYRYANGSSFSYAIPMTNGTYSVTLRFCETNHGDSVGMRVGNYSLQGTTVLSNFDILATAGSYDTPVDETFNVTVTGGTLNVGVGIVTGYPRLDAIVVKTQ